jgi:lipopolysaccharide/colanic/teichoic acid biosynthesis glycosyltransferase
MRQLNQPANIEHLIRHYEQQLDSFPRRLQLAAKRIIDIIGSVFGLVLISPLLLLLAVLVRIESPGPSIFRQKRLGQYGKEFTIYKFRSMHQGSEIKLNADGSTCVCSLDPRVTKLGHFIRWTGLDELPQLFNVLKGEMSLIGPRADPAFYIENYNDEDYYKLAMRPGITAYAQVLGRQTIGWRERFSLEHYYIEHYSLWFDVKIMWQTLLVIWQRVGVYNESETESSTITVSREQMVIDN